MTHERVDVYMDWMNEQMNVVSVMELKNQGEADTVLFGYPEDYKESFDDTYMQMWRPDTGKYRLHNFQIIVDGNPVKYNRQTGRNTPGLFNAYSWLVWEIPFEAGQSRTLVMEYLAYPFEYSDYQDEQGYEYVLGTAHTYCDTPDFIEVSFHARLLAPERVIAAPESYSFTYTPDDYYQVNWIWRFDNYKPAENAIIDLKLKLNPNSRLQMHMQTQGCLQEFRNGYYPHLNLPSLELAASNIEQRLNDTQYCSDPLPELRLCYVLMGNEARGSQLIHNYLISHLFANDYATTKPIMPTQVSGYTFSCETPEQLAIRRNEVYAVHGYLFQQPLWREFFKRTTWYKPIENLGNISDYLSLAELSYVQAIQQRERQLAPTAIER